MRRCKILRADRASYKVKAGSMCYRVADPYGCASDDTRMTGIEHVCVSMKESGMQFFTIPLEDLEEEIDTMHDLLRGLPGGESRFPLNRQPWDWKIIPPSSFDDEAVLTVLIKWTKGGTWDKYRYRVILEAMNA